MATWRSKMPKKGYKHFPEAKEKMRQKALGRIPWNKGLTKETDERVKKQSKTHKGFRHTNKVKELIGKKGKGRIPWNKGLTKETDKRVAEYSKKIEVPFSGGRKEKISIARKKYFKEHPEAVLEMRKKLRGKIPWNKDLTVKDDNRILAGSKSPSWENGKSFEPYGVEFNNGLKKEIRERDSYQCQLCGKFQQELRRKLDIHHINYNKKDSRKRNLIGLDEHCHKRTRINRDKWQFLFETLQEIRQI